jgi:hypothetical protein
MSSLTEIRLAGDTGVTLSCCSIRWWFRFRAEEGSLGGISPLVNVVTPTIAAERMRMPTVQSIQPTGVAESDAGLSIAPYRPDANLRRSREMEVARARMR